MKAAEKIATMWLLTLGLMCTTFSVSARLEQSAKDKKNQVSFPESELPVSTSGISSQDALFPFLIVGVPSLLLGGWLGLKLCGQIQLDKKEIQQAEQVKLLSIFYHMLQKNEGKITVLRFAMVSQLPPAEAKDFLDRKAKEFQANFQVSEDGTVSYYFEI